MSQPLRGAPLGGGERYWGQSYCTTRTPYPSITDGVT